MATPEGMARLSFDIPDFEDEEVPLAGPPPLAETKGGTLPGLKIRDQVFDEFQDFSGYTFTGPVEFKNVRFLKGFSFAGATFLKSLRLNKVSNDRVPGSRADFSEANFFQAVSIKQKSALYLANFKRANFVVAASFKGSSFYASASFEGTKFRGSADFSKSQFNGIGDFSRAEFSGNTDFTEVVFRYYLSHARFQGVAFSAPVSFASALFAGNADFSEATFNGGASFREAWFCEAQEDADEEPEGEKDWKSPDLFVKFDGCVFRPEIGDKEVISFHSAKVGNRTLPRSLTFIGSHFFSAGKAHDATADFSYLHCIGSMSLSEAQFHDGVSAEFAHSTIEKELDLEDCIFAGDAIFQRAHLQSDLFLASTQFRQYPDFRKAKLAAYPHLSEAKLPSNAKYGRSREELLSRISALRKIASHADDKKLELELLVRELKLGGGVASWFYGVIANYGQSWLRPTAWLLLFAFAIFPPLYLANSGVLPLSQDALQDVVANHSLPCRNGVAGNALSAALDLSVKNALIVASENEARNTRIDTCLGNSGPQGRQGLVATVLEASEKILTLVFVFFIGASIRRRLLIR